MDEALLRRARRRSVSQTAAAIGVLVLLVGSLMFVLTSREQSRTLDTELGQVVAAAEDVDDPPPGQALARLVPATGRIETTPSAALAMAAVVTAAVRRAPGRYDASTSAGQPVRVLVADRPDGQRWAVAADLRPLHDRRAELGAILVLAELAGLAGAVGAAVALSRRAVAPLALALAEQRRFVADASHELRAPLTVLHTRAQLLARRARTDPAERIAGQLDELVADTRALGEVVEDLLVSAEVQHRLRAEGLVYLASLARVVVGSMAAYAQTRQVDLRVEAEEAVPVVGAPAALRRALSALVDNAIGHVAEGGRVVVRVDRVGTEALASVADNGVGLDPAEADRLFDRFAHGTAGTGRRFGLGLALVRQVAAAHGGSVRVTGAVRVGATFTLVLPAAEPAAG